MFEFSWLWIADADCTWVPDLSREARVRARMCIGMKINFCIGNYMHFVAILTSCIRHDVNNVKERRIAGDFVPKCLQCKIRGKGSFFMILQHNFDF